MKLQCLYIQYRKLLLVTVPVRAGMARYFQTRPPLGDGHGRVAVN
jgi:hypothetical protein